jgi:hypothetical protein
MADMEKAGARDISTSDLIARARALRNQSSARASSPSTSPAEAPESGPNLADHRRYMLTRGTAAVAVIGTQFSEYFDDNEEVWGMDEAPIDDYANDAMTDVIWLLVDTMSLGPNDVEVIQFLTDAERPVPPVPGDRPIPESDLQKFVALAVENKDDQAFEALCVVAVTVLLGFARAWPRDLHPQSAVAPTVEELLNKMYGWATEPWTLEVWNEDEDEYFKAPLDPPKKHTVVTQAACCLEMRYEGLFASPEANG